MQTSYPALRVIVADNASTDDSLIFLRESYPSVEVITLEENFGFAEGYNQALKQVDSEYLVILNSDVELTSGWLMPMISFMEEHPNVAAAQPKILSYLNKDHFEYAGAAGGWIDAFGYPFSRGRIFDHCEKDNAQYNNAEEIFWASGACLLIRNHLFQKSGGFDGWFFAHMEEIDLCWRLQLMGYSIYSLPQSVVYHVGGGTLPKGNSRKVFLNFRNNQVMLAKNLPWAEKWWKVPFRMALDQVAAVKALLGGDGGYFIAVLKAHFAFIYWIFAGRDSQLPAKTQRLTNLNGVFRGNIVWDFFINNRRTFNSLFEKKEND